VARVAATLQAELGWDETQLREQLDAWRAEARAEGVVGNA
jgi:hypothetical protein